MNCKLFLYSVLMGLTAISCQQRKDTAASMEGDVPRQQVFDKGSKITNDNFTGTVWLQMLVDADSINQNSVGSVTFEPGARTNWHSHPNGQIILALSGKGFYQEEGSPKRILKKGDAVKCPPNTPHWHGANTDEEFVQVAITSRIDGPTQWLDKVTDDTYLK